MNYEIQNAGARKSRDTVLLWGVFVERTRRASEQQVKIFKMLVKSRADKIFCTLFQAAYRPLKG